MLSLGNAFDEALNLNGKNKHDNIKVHKGKKSNTNHNIRNRTKDLTPELLDKFIPKNHFNPPSCTSGIHKQRWQDMQKNEALMSRDRFVESISNRIYKPGTKRSVVHDMNLQDNYNLIESIRQGRVDMKDVGQSVDRPGYTYNAQNAKDPGDTLPPHWSQVLRQGWALAQSMNPRLAEANMPYAPTGMNMTFHNDQNPANHPGAERGGFGGPPGDPAYGPRVPRPQPRQPAPFYGGFDPRERPPPPRPASPLMGRDQSQYDYHRHEDVNYYDQVYPGHPGYGYDYHAPVEQAVEVKDERSPDASRPPSPPAGGGRTTNVAAPAPQQAASTSNSAREAYSRNFRDRFNELNPDPHAADPDADRNDYTYTHPDAPYTAEDTRQPLASRAAGATTAASGRQTELPLHLSKEAVEAQFHASERAKNRLVAQNQAQIDRREKETARVAAAQSVSREERNAMHGRLQHLNAEILSLNEEMVKDPKNAYEHKERMEYLEQSRELLKADMRSWADPVELQPPKMTKFVAPTETLEQRIARQGEELTRARIQLGLARDQRLSSAAIAAYQRTVHEREHRLDASNAELRSKTPGKRTLVETESKTKKRQKHLNR
jgi:hypothetical protein